MKFVAEQRTSIIIIALNVPTVECDPQTCIQR